MSKITIDKNVYMPYIKEKYGKEGHAFPDESVDFAGHVGYFAQKWMDEAPWESDPELDTPRELRISLRRYIKRNIDLQDHRRSYFVPSFVWVFLAQQLIGWIVRLIIEHYFAQISEDFPKNKS